MLIIVVTGIAAIIYLSIREPATDYSASPPPHAPDTTTRIPTASSAIAIKACDEPQSKFATQQIRTSRLWLDLPADFGLTSNIAGGAIGDFPRRAWRGPDNSTVTVEPASSSDVHSGWTGLILSECDVEIGRGWRVHIDIANASVNVPDFIVHAHFTDGTSAVRYLGHARSHQRHSDLLAAARSMRL